LQAGTYETRAKPIGAGNDSVPASNLIDTVKQFEAGGAPGGFFRTAYWDVHQWSIGYGTRSKQGEVINQAEAEKRLASELAMHRGRVEKANTEYQLGLTPNEVDALTSFDFNTGHLDSLLNGGTRSKAEIAATLPLYRHAGGERLPGLEARRAAEQAIFLNGYAGKAASVPTAPSPVAKNPLKIQPWQPSYRSNPM
jgi:GH24 family phage-related lysozyme (muramidase)